MGLSVLFITVGLALAAFYLGSGHADLGPPLTDHGPPLTDRLQALEVRLGQLEREREAWRVEKLAYENMKLEWEETKQQWQSDKLKHDALANEWQDMKRQWQDEKVKCDGLKAGWEETELQLKTLVTELVKKEEKFEEERRVWRSEKQQMEKNEQELKQALAELKKGEKVPDNTMFADFKTSTVQKSEHASHDVIPRADDTGAWEPVVSQMSQKLTEMEAQLQTTENEVQTVKNVNSQQDQAIQDARASVYVRWGRSVCPSADSLVYSGFVGGSWFERHGGPGNYLCLTKSPVAGSHSHNSWVAELFGGEYQTETDSHQNEDPVCAVCRSHYPTTMMVPGTNRCPSGWTVEYSGYLMAGPTGYPSASEFICVDSYFEELPGGEASENGKLMYLTLAKCGSLPCPPYHNNMVVTCAVCSK